MISASGNEVVMNVNATATGDTTVQFSGIVQSCFGDDPSVLLPGHTILVGNLILPTTYLYSIDANSFTETGTKEYNDSSDEEGWTKISDGLAVNYDLFQTITTGAGYAEKYDAWSGLWSSISPADGTANGTLPVLSSTQVGYELGPSLRLQDGRVFQIGANQYTALYRPFTNTWAAGPEMLADLKGPGGTLPDAKYGADDASAAELPNGHIILTADAGPNPVTLNGNTSSTSATIRLPSTAGLQVGWSLSQADGNNTTIPYGSYIYSVDSAQAISLGNAGQKIDALANNASIALVFGGIFSFPTQVFDFDPESGTMTPISGPGSLLPGEPSYVTRMLVLPTGELLFNDSSNQLYVYRSDGFAPSFLLPEINDVAYRGDATFTLTGKRLNGQSAGAAYGDDAQMDENYPIVRLTDPFTRDVFYCRTTNWSSTGVGNSVDPESVDFSLNQNLTPGYHFLTVTGAGLSSLPTVIRITSEEVEKSERGNGNSSGAVAIAQPLSTGAARTHRNPPVSLVPLKK